MAKASRRELLKAALGIPLAGLAGGLAKATLLEPTPEIPDDDDPTPPAEEGPYFKASSPKRTSLLEEGLKGEKLVIEGRVLDRRGNPVDAALLDFWQCDAAGDYDNQGFKLRGHQFTGIDGKFRLETVRPGLYPGRTRHIHVKVKSPQSKVLTTQLFFPNEAGNRRDGIFRKELLIKVGADTSKPAGFDFVLNI
jgi:protocatechuate 3,4-dioxygenase beta subunit